MNERKTTNILLLIIVIPILFYLLKILSFIFIPLIFSMFIALLFLPLMRWLKKQKVPKAISIFIVFLIIAMGVKTGSVLIQLSSQEIISSDAAFFDKIGEKFTTLVRSVEAFFGIENTAGNYSVKDFFQKENIAKNFGVTLSIIGNMITMTLMTVFFVILWLAESINFQKVLNSTILKQRHTSLKAFMKMEKDLMTFIKVKFFVSLATGVGIGLCCVFFDVSFPIFWGLFAFLINFVQMIGSFISVILLALFAFVELDISSTLLFFVIAIAAVQVLFGSILEPIFMGKSFSINVITILIMLMFWGYLWGVAGLVMSIPITVFIKIILEQYPSTKVIGELMSGSIKKQ